MHSVPRPAQVVLCKLNVACALPQGCFAHNHVQGQSRERAPAQAHTQAGARTPAEALCAGQAPKRARLRERARARAAAHSSHPQIAAAWVRMQASTQLLRTRFTYLSLASPHPCGLLLFVMLLPISFLQRMCY